jgi:hypothetical protein
MAAPPCGSGCSLWESKDDASAMRAHAATVRSRAARGGFAFLATVGLAASTTLHPVAAQAPKLLADTCPVATSPMNFASTTYQCFTIPPKVTEIEAGLVGGSGGPGYNPTGAGAPLGGSGAVVVSVVYVTPGEKLYLGVAGSGYSGGPPVAGATPGQGGFGGGGNAGTSALAAGQPPAGGGGGATVLSSKPLIDCGKTPAGVAALTSEILVAGGGGGGGENNANSDGDIGGHGGTAQGVPEPGGAGTFTGELDGQGGGSGSQTAAGSGGGAGTTGNPGTAGIEGCGGTGGNGTGGGGGGGGYFAGGGGGGGAEGAAGSGGGGGGGSGSSYANRLMTCDATNGATTLATSRVGPRATIIFPPQDPCPTLTFEPDVSSGGFAVQVVGTGWKPGLPVTLAWAELGSVPVAAVPVGTVNLGTNSTFTYTIVLMTHDEIGQRALIATEATAGYSNVAGLLLANSPEEPPTFLFRR